jgi:hypothetical protein
VSAAQPLSSISTTENLIPASENTHGILAIGTFSNSLQKSSAVTPGGCPIISNVSRALHQTTDNCRRDRLRKLIRFSARVPCTRLPNVFAESGLRLPVSDQGMKELNQMEKLIFLDLRQTKITDAGFQELKSLKNLKHVHTVGTKVTDAGANRLKESLPLVQIN